MAGGVFAARLGGWPCVPAARKKGLPIGKLLDGVLYAGYGWAEEARIWLLVFGVPAATVLAARRRAP